MTTTGSIQHQYFKQLDGFRFLSISAVMISHFGESPAMNRIPLGYGVLFFFILSSFLITRILLISKDNNEENGVGHFFSLRQFYARRSLRIFPIYYFLIVLMYILNWVPCREVIVYLLTYTINIKIANGFNAGNFNHLWSLAVEEQFYILFPFIVFFIRTRYLFKTIIFLTIVGVLGRALLYTYNRAYIPFSNFHTISALDSLGIGSILAYLSLYKMDFLKRIITNRILTLSSIFLFCFLMVFSFSLYPNNSKYNFTSIVIMRFVFNVMGFWILGRAITVGYSGIIKSILENRVVVYLGRISYGMYLYHLFVPHVTNLVLNRLGIELLNEEGSFHLLTKGIIYTIATIGIASLSWFLFESPVNSLKRYFSYTKINTVGNKSL